jgi:hypothetical protein
MKIGHQKNFWGGMLFVALGLIFAVIARGVPGLSFLPGYSMGTPARMGPGFFPFYLWVLASICAFGLLLKIIGMLLSGIILVVGASLGSQEFRLKPVLILAVALVIFCAFVFVAGLKLPIPLCPDVESLQEYKVCRA